MPFFHHELVKQLLLACMSHPAQEDSFLQLVQHLAASGELSLSQLVKARHKLFTCRLPHCCAAAT